ncbi:ribbon-helix-helix domain-containing protein [Peribacillus muralis]|uniref:ribbon-helix-helix domain-containing protein n=1 Tax=Peribacillus muralis TaxID=264697 RepID=UPI003D030B1E
MNEKRGLKNRTPLSNAVRTELHLQLKQLSETTKVPMSKLLDEAIEDLLKKRR